MSVPSPCIGVCQVDRDQVCTGCGRSLAEIAAWSQLGDETQARIVALARLRLSGRIEGEGS